MIIEPVGEGGGSRSVGKKFELAVVQGGVAVAPRVAVWAVEEASGSDFAQRIEGECQQVLGGLGQGFRHGSGAFLLNAELPEFIVFLGQ